MIASTRYDYIKKKHGAYGSWAIWPPAGDKPKSNMGDMSIFHPDRNPRLFESLNPQVIMVGLNFSRPVEFTEPFLNFHDKCPWANDFKIRYAFSDTPYSGAYMTDAIKNLPEVNSKKVVGYLQQNPELILKNLEMFREEIEDLGGTPPTILAFGRDAHCILLNNLLPAEYRRLIKITHYSHQISKEKYRLIVHQEIEKALNPQ